MRRTLIGLATLLLAGGLTALTGFTPAHAHSLRGTQCPSSDGTPPGSFSSVTVVGTGGSTPFTTLYIDDRDYLDINPFPAGNRITGGLWIYLESGAAAGLQRGGDQVAFTILNPNLPFIAPIPVLPPNPGGAPVLPEGLTLFPEGFGGGSTSEAAGVHDTCVESDTDILLF